MIYRVEDKYILPWAQMYEMEAKIKAVLRPDAFSAAGGAGYKISSLYFDDLYDSCFEDSESGNPIRDKYRIRIYNDSLQVIKLEVKRKRYNRAYKVTSSISAAELQDLIEGVPIAQRDSLDDARTLFNVAMLTRGLRPRVNVTYNRRAYVCDSGNVRITFDRQIRFNDQVESFGRPGLAYEYPDGPGTVLEVKYDQVLPHYVAQVLECGKLVQMANSKYALCREALEQWQMTGKQG